MKKEIVELLGPVGVNWDFEEEEIVHAQGNRIRALVKLTLKKGSFSKKEITINVWGSAYGYTIESKKEAVENAINMGTVLLGLHQETPTPLSSIIERLGPLGLHWGYQEEGESFIINGNVVCSVEVNVSKSKLSLNGKGSGALTHKATGYASLKSEYPEDEALINAILEAFSWFGINPEYDEYEETFTTSDRLPEKEKGNGKKFLAITAVLALGTAFCAGLII